MKNQYNLNCNIAQTLNMVGDKWSLLILHELLHGPSTFKDLQSKLEGIPTNLLSDRLKRLEADELIISSLYQSHPPRYEYTLTDSGLDLQDVFNSLVIWGNRHLKPAYKQLVHNQCGQAVEIKYYCNHCQTIMPKEECSSCSTSD